jgi:hypothetical protein
MAIIPLAKLLGFGIKGPKATWFFS